MTINELVANAFESFIIKKIIKKKESFITVLKRRGCAYDHTRKY